MGCTHVRWWVFTIVGFTNRRERHIDVHTYIGEALLLLLAVALAHGVVHHRPQHQQLHGLQEGGHPQDQHAGVRQPQLVVVLFGRMRKR